MEWRCVVVECRFCACACAVGDVRFCVDPHTGPEIVSLEASERLPCAEVSFCVCLVDDGNSHCLRYAESEEWSVVYALFEGVAEAE